MRNLMNRLWKDEGGFVISFELILIATLLVLGIIVGLTSVRNATVNELSELATAVGIVDQSYGFSGLSGCCGQTDGSAASDPNSGVGLDIDDAVCTDPSNLASIDQDPCS